MTWMSNVSVYETAEGIYLPICDACYALLDGAYDWTSFAQDGEHCVICWATATAEDEDGNSADAR